MKQNNLDTVGLNFHTNVCNCNGVLCYDKIQTITCLPYLPYVFGQIDLSKQCRPR